MKKETANKAEKGSKSSSRFLKYFVFLVIAGVIGVVIASVKYFGTEKAERYSSAMIEFTYDGAARNLTPSGQRFSIDALTGDEVLNAALASLNLSDRYTAENLRGSIVVKGSYPKDVISRIKGYDSLFDFSSSREISLQDYYPTIYSIILYDDFDKNASSNTMNSIVKAVADSYKEYFIKKYAYSFDMDKYDSLLSLDDYDYRQQIKVLRQRLQMIEKYSAEMYAENSVFKKDGFSFNDIFLKCRDISNDSLSKLEASVTINAYTTSSSRLKNQYEYEIKLLSNELEYKKTNLEELNNLIDNYQMDDILYITSGDSMVKVDSNSSRTYEDLITQKREITDRIVEINTEIKEYEQYLNDLTVSATKPAYDKETVENDLKEISSLIDKIERSFAALLSAYNESIIPADAVSVENVKHNSAKLLSTGFIATAVKCAGPLCMLVLIACGIHAFIFEIRAYNARKAEESNA
ncbi:MAG: hypothetical protein K6E85_00715 [Lachnospiraceae bacterium]|nr:hypothetical protein [Lachnospiraceae bacterium]